VRVSFSQLIDFARLLFAQGDFTIGRTNNELVSMFRLTLSASVALAIPKFPLDWSSNQESFLVVKQGDFTIDDKGSFCCPEGVPKAISNLGLSRFQLRGADPVPEGD